MIITRTPFRISFFGGGTDYPVWYREHGGAVLAMAIDKYCYITCRYLPPFFEHHSRIIYTEVENVVSNDLIRHPAVRACLAHLKIEQGVEIHHDADLPARTGLGTSSSFVVGLLNALYALQNQRRSKADLAREAIHIEQTVLAENVGVQDQTTAAHGGLNQVRFHPDDQIEVQPLVVPRGRLELLQDHLHLYFTGFSRTASEIAKEQIQNTSQRQEELKELLAMVDYGTTLITDPRQSFLDFGKLLDRAWQLKRRLSSRISTSDIDQIYDLAKKSGALGGKLLGAGGGGFLLFFVPPEAQPRFREGMNRFLRVPFKISPQGSEVVLYEASEAFDDSLSLNRVRAYAQHA